MGTHRHSLNIVSVLAGVVACALTALAGEARSQITPGPGTLSAANLGHLTGPATADGYGAAVAVLADLTGDGIPEMAVGAPLENAPGPAAGAVYVHSGADGALLLKKSGSASDDHLGTALADAGDLDGDGVHDLVAGAPGSTDSLTTAGRLLAWSGADGHLLWQIEGAHPGDRLGQSVAAAGDLNGDGVPDLVVGIPDVDQPLMKIGAVRTVSGVDGATIWEKAFGGSGPDALFFGTAVAAVGDLDVDGRSEIVACGPAPMPGFGLPGSANVLSGLNGTVYAVLAGDEGQWLFGSSVAGVGDVNADGRPDFAIGAPGAAGGVGAVRVYSGKTLAMLYEFRGTKVGDKLGGPGSLAGVGDVDGDGHDDVLAAMPQADNGRGRIEIRSGATGFTLLDESCDLAGGAFGLSVAGAPDLDGDGVPDMLVAFPGASPTLPGSPPQVLMLSGVPALHVAPVLRAKGTLLAGSPVALLLTDGTPLAPAALVIGLSTVLLPFKGGTLVPAPDLILAGLPLDGAGELTLQAHWPAGLSGIPLWMQAWIAEPLAAHGYTATNSLSLLAP